MSFPNGTEDAPAKLARNTGRYLRRRCRVITHGTPEFREIMNSLLSRQYDRNEAIKRFEESWESLEDPYEQVMAHAAYLESAGNITFMHNVLKNQRFRGAEESARMLYEAIACEKLDDLNGAQKLLRTILDTEKDMSIVRAAQFNMHVCYEKAAKFDNVNFEAFLTEKDIVFIDNERLSDKAVAMHMIVCMEQGWPFLHLQHLNESMDYLSANSIAGYAKTLLTKIEYDKSYLSPEMMDTIVNHLNRLDTNSRTAIMVRLSDYLPASEEMQRKAILERVRQESVKDETVAKWKQAHYHPAGGDGEDS